MGRKRKYINKLPIKYSQKKEKKHCSVYTSSQFTIIVQVPYYIYLKYRGVNDTEILLATIKCMCHAKMISPEVSHN